MKVDRENGFGQGKGRLEIRMQYIFLKMNCTLSIS